MEQSKIIETLETYQEADTHVDEETEPSISSNLWHIASFLDLHSVGAPRSLKGRSVSGQLVEFQPHIAWDDLCIHNALMPITLKTK